jgi:hypothetical protein
MSAPLDEQGVAQMKLLPVKKADKSTSAVSSGEYETTYRIQVIGNMIVRPTR